MKPQTLTKTLLAALVLTSTSQASPALRSKISAKEKQLATLRAEIATLKKQLSSDTSTSYIVKPGDTHSSIARRHGSSPEALMKMNNLTDPSRLLVGQKLTLNGATSTSHKKQSLASYTVKKGDTFYSIARRHKLSVSDLQALNPSVNASHITRGQTLAINASTAMASKPKARKNDGAQLISTRQEAPKKTSSKKKSRKSSPTPTAQKTPMVTPPAPKLKKESKPEIKPELAPIPAPIIKKEIPQPEPLNETPAPTPVVEEQAPSPSGVSSIILTQEMTFDEFATKHGTSTGKLNELNGWNLPKSTTLARGSEIYIPK